MDTILGQKKQMSQVFVNGRRIPVTKISTNPCVVTYVKTQGKDGYWAVQLGYGEKSVKNTPKSLRGHLKNTHKKAAPIFIRETVFKSEPKVNVGDTLKASDIFGIGDKISVTGVSKGKGFAGGVKRWGFAGGPKTHGQSDRQRAPGSIGQGTTPGRVRKGKKMAGRMGTQTVTIKNLKIVSIDEESGDIFVSGPIAGHLNTPVVVSLLSKAKKTSSASNSGSTNSIQKDSEEQKEEKPIEESKEQTESKEDNKVDKNVEEKEDK